MLSLNTLLPTGLRLFLLLGPASLSVATHACHPQECRPSFSPATPPAVWTYRLLPAPDSTFGYEVRQQGQPLIRQLSVPGRPGTLGFARASTAHATATLVVAKLQRGQRFPTITRPELDSLEAL